MHTRTEIELQFPADAAGVIEGLLTDAARDAGVTVDQRTARVEVIAERFNVPAHFFVTKIEDPGRREPQLGVWCLVLGRLEGMIAVTETAQRYTVATPLELTRDQLRVELPVVFEIEKAYRRHLRKT